MTQYSYGCTQAKLTQRNYHMGRSSCSDMTRLLIIQPYIPSYRVPLFSSMKQQLSANGIELAIAAADPGDEQRQRGDDYTDLCADFKLQSRQVSLARRTLLWRDLSPALEAHQPDLIIVEQAVKNLESVGPLLSQRFGSRPQVAMWGQGRSYSTRQTPLEAGFKQWLTQRSSWFFAYTPAGAEHVVSRGFPSDRVTILWNSNDAEALQRDLATLTSEDVEAFRRKLGLEYGRTGLFIGGVDQRKGISFLVASARLVAESLPGFKLLVGGTGDMAEAVRAEESSGGPVRMLGRIDGRQKALALAASDVLMIPQWIGLVAVDALVAKKTLVTTDHPSHSPEIEYLTFGVNAFTTSHDPTSYARTVVRCLSETCSLSEPASAGALTETRLGISTMANNFVEGIELWRTQCKLEGELK